MHPPRLRSFSYLGIHRYYLTLCTDGRVPHFTTDAAIGPVLAQFRQSAACASFQMDAYCFMPDHLHVLCAGLDEAADLRAFVTDAKQGSGFRFAAATGRRLWQKGFYDHVLRDDEDFLPVVRYVLGSPLRGGLCEKFGEHPYCGSEVYSHAEIADCLQSWTPPWQR